MYRYQPYTNTVSPPVPGLYSTAAYNYCLPHSCKVAYVALFHLALKSGVF